MFMIKEIGGIEESLGPWFKGQDKWQYLAAQKRPPLANI